METTFDNFNLHFCEINGKSFMVVKPSERMGDAEYDRLKEHIEKFGGHWREAVGGFCFGVDESLVYNRRHSAEVLQYFPTPELLVNRMVQLSGIEDYVKTGSKAVLLEPSAGEGRILDGVANKIGNMDDVYAVEISDTNAEVLRSKGYRCVCDSFENFFDENKHKNLGITHVIMNPPFSKSRDIKHTIMAYELMSKGGVLVGIISENSLYWKSKVSEEFKSWLERKNAYIEEVPYGTFKESGTLVDTLLIKIIK